MLTIIPSFQLRTNVDYIEEVQCSRILGEWNNMVGFELGSSRAGVYTTAKPSPVEKFKHK